MGLAVILNRLGPTDCASPGEPDLTSGSPCCRLVGDDAACRTRRCCLVILSAESVERSTTHLCQIFDVTWLLCHPDLSRLRIYDLVPGSPTRPGSTLQDGVGRLRLGRLLAPGMIDCSMSIGHVSAYLGPAAVQSGD